MYKYETGENIYLCMNEKIRFILTQELTQNNQKKKLFWST